MKVKEMENERMGSSEREKMFLCLHLACHKKAHSIK